MSNAELALEIARLVTRAVGGETVDPRRAGVELAARFPELGVPGELIGKAIARAAGMVGIELAADGADDQIAHAGLCKSRPIASPPVAIVRRLFMGG